MVEKLATLQLSKRDNISKLRINKYHCINCTILLLSIGLVWWCLYRKSSKKLELRVSCRFWPHIILRTTHPLNVSTCVAQKNVRKLLSYPVWLAKWHVNILDYKIALEIYSNHHEHITTHNNKCQAD